MLQLFKNIRLSSAVIIFFWGLIIRVPFLIHAPGNETRLLPWLVKGDASFASYYWVSVLLAYLLVYISAMVFNKVCIDQDVIYQHTYMPGFFLVTFSAIYHTNIYLDNAHFALFFLTIAISNLFKLYNSESSHGDLYNISALCCLSGFAMPGLFAFIVYIPIAAMVFKKVTVRDIIAIIMGFGTPLIIYFGLNYIFRTEKFSLSGLSWGIEAISLKKFQNFFAFIAILLLSFMGIAKAFSNFRKNTIKTRRINLMLLSYLGFSVLLILINFRSLPEYHIITVFTTAPTAAYLFLGSKKKIWKEVGSWLVIAIVLFSLYGIEIKL